MSIPSATEFVLDNSPYLVCVLYAALLLHSTAQEILWVVFGQFCCNTISGWLKNRIKEPRPVGGSTKKRGYGMPSAHSASLAYTATAWTMYLLARRVAAPSRVLDGKLILIGLHLSALLVAWSRVYMNHHTTKQVILGYLGGTVFALLWLLPSTGVGQEAIGSEVTDQRPVFRA